MKRTFPRNSALAVALTILAALVCALPAVAADQKANASADIEPAAITALDNMGKYLRTLKAIQIEAAIQREEVLDNGLKVQFAEVATLLARKPDRIRVVVLSDRKERHFLFDGKLFTLWAPRVNYYATVPAPPTIGEVADALQEKFGIEMPLVDLYRWGDDAGSAAGITAAVDVGPSKIGSADCEQYALRQEGIDWQIWIQQGEFPLPHKVVITTTTDEARPQYQATYTWNLAPTITDADFTFDPPTDAQRILLKEIAPEADASTKEK